MPKFFFDISDGKQLVVDTVGIDLADAEAARDEATRTLSEIAAQEIPADGPHRLFQITVYNFDHTTQFEVRIEFQSLSEHNVIQDGGSGEDDEPRR